MFRPQKNFVEGSDLNSFFHGTYIIFDKCNSFPLQVCFVMALTGQILALGTNFVNIPVSPTFLNIRLFPSP
jgi:hypothetical protein